MSIYSQYAEANVALQGALDALKARSEKLNQLIAEARGILGILEKYGGDVSEGEWARISNGPFNRLCEILDELERLP